MRKLTKLLMVSLVAGSLSMGAAPAAQADPPVKDTAKRAAKFRGVSAEPGAKAKLRMKKAGIEAARKSADSRQRSKGETGDQQSARKQLLDAAKKSGTPLSSSDVDVFELADSDVTVAAPKGVAIDSLNVELTGESLAVESESSARAGDSASGPGMGWGSRADGQYIVTVRGWGTATFLWKRAKRTNDGSSKYDWYSYARKAVAQPASIPWSADPRVALLRVQSYPYDSIESRLRNWVDLEPATDRNGDCKGNMYVEATVAGAGAVGYNFADCDHYDVWHNPNKPGSYYIEMNQGLSVNSGPREAAYSITFKVKQGTPGSLHDVNKVLFTFRGSRTTCTSTDTSKTCNP